MTYVIHDSPVPICIYRFRPMVILSGHASQNWRRNTVSSHVRCSLSLRLLLVPAHHQNPFPATRRTPNHQSSPEWKDPFQYPPPRGRLPKDLRGNEPKFYVKGSSVPLFMPGKRYSLPNLPYKYNALEPTISEKIMTLHHDKNHLAYVKGTNPALDKLEKARQTGFAGIALRGISRDPACNA